MKNILYEYEPILDEKFKEYILQTEALHKYFKLDWDILKPRQYCGIINYDGDDFYLLPKIANHNSDINLNIFIYMLMYAYDIKVENEDFSSSENQKNTILEIFIQLFAQRLLKEFKSGVYKEYITEQDNLTALRGKYLINENLKYNFVKSKIYCEYDEFSMDNQLNQFFLYAIKSLMKFTKNKKLLKQCELILDEVSVKIFDINKLHIHFNRLNKRYKDSYEFALLLLSKSIPLFSKDKKSFAFLFDMNVLFERFIGRIYKNIDTSTSLQNQTKFEDLQLKPDIMTSTMIIDTKYKKVKNKGDLSTADKYQMFAYGRNFKRKETMLLYPKHLDEYINENLKLGEGDEMVNLKMRSIDLDFLGEFDAFIKEIKIRVEYENGT